MTPEIARDSIIDNLDSIRLNTIEHYRTLALNAYVRSFEYGSERRDGHYVHPHGTLEIYDAFVSDNILPKLSIRWDEVLRPTLQLLAAVLNDGIPFVICADRLHGGITAGMNIISAKYKRHVTWLNDYREVIGDKSYPKHVTAVTGLLVEESEECPDPIVCKVMIHTLLDRPTWAKHSLRIPDPTPAGTGYLYTLEYDKQRKQWHLESLCYLESKNLSTLGDEWEDPETLCGAWSYTPNMLLRAPTNLMFMSTTRHDDYNGQPSLETIGRKSFSMQHKDPSAYIGDIYQRIGVKK